MEKVVTMCCYYNPGQIFGRKYRNPAKPDSTRKVWYLLLRVFLTAIAKVYFWKRDWTLDCLHPNLRFS